MHAMDICHRDIKPHNLLVDSRTHVLKVCDFGSAKRLVEGEPNTAYICSRFYRAPELILGATDYTTVIDIWSAACVTSELLLGRVVFPGDSATDQLVEIIKVLGTPSREDLLSMNPNYGEFKFPPIKAHSWTKVFRRATPELVDLLSRILQYRPKQRPNGLNACAHIYFNELRVEGTQIGSKSLPPQLHWFSKEEYALMDETLKEMLIPDWVGRERGNWQTHSVKSASPPAYSTLYMTVGACSPRRHGATGAAGACGAPGAAASTGSRRDRGAALVPLDDSAGMVPDEQARNFAARSALALLPQGKNPIDLPLSLDALPLPVEHTVVCIHRDVSLL